MQNGDDEGTFVTITTEQDVKNAKLCCKPMPALHENRDIARLYLRVDDTPDSGLLILMPWQYE